MFALPTKADTRRGWIWDCRSPGESPAVSANPLPINTCDFLRDVTPISACHRPNRRNRLSFTKCLYLFRHHASRLGSGQSTAGGNAHQTKCHDGLRLQCQHGRLRRYGKPVVPTSKQVAHCAFSNLRHIRRAARFLPDDEINRWEALQNGHRNCS
jgi:hypothetical protein